MAYLALAYQFASEPHSDNLYRGSTLIFATVIRFSNGGTHKSVIHLFVFAIVAAGFRTGFRDTLLLTLCCVTSYALVVEISDGLRSAYLMRAV